MTVTKYNELINKAPYNGKLIEDKMVSPPFCLEDVHLQVFSYDGYKVAFHDGGFLWMEEEATDKAIQKEDLTSFDVEEMTDAQLALLIRDANKIIGKRQKEKAQEAINQFIKAWENLQRFGEVRLRVEPKGEKHFHTTVDKLKLEVLRLE